jgi:hypothetical protein
LLLLMTGLAVAGFLDLIIRTPSMGDYFLLTYVLVLLVVPFSQQRYLLPLMPLYLLYICRATEQIGRLAARTAGRLHTRARHVAPAIVGMVFAASYASSYLLSDAGVIERGVESSDSRELFEFIRQNTPQDSFLAFYKPRPLALFTGRHATRYHWEPDGEKLWRELLEMGISHIVLPKYIDPERHSDYIFPAAVERYRANLELLFENRNFVVYRIVTESHRAP